MLSEWRSAGQPPPAAHSSPGPKSGPEPLWRATGDTSCRSKPPDGSREFTKIASASINLAPVLFSVMPGGFVRHMRRRRETLPDMDKTKEHPVLSYEVVDGID